MSRILSRTIFLVAAPARQRCSSARLRSSLLRNNRCGGPRSSCRPGRSRPNIASMVQTLVTIRNARERDAEGIAEVHDAAWRQGLPRHHSRARTREDDRAPGDHGGGTPQFCAGRVLWCSISTRRSAAMRATAATACRRCRLGGEIFELISRRSSRASDSARNCSPLRARISPITAMPRFSYGRSPITRMRWNSTVALAARSVRHAYERFGTELRERIAFAFE